MSLECFTPQPAPFPKRRGWRVQKNEIRKWASLQFLHVLTSRGCGLVAAADARTGRGGPARCRNRRARQTHSPNFGAPPDLGHLRCSTICFAKQTPTRPPRAAKNGFLKKDCILCNTRWRTGDNNFQTVLDKADRNPKRDPDPRATQVEQPKGCSTRRAGP